MVGSGEPERLRTECVRRSRLRLCTGLTIALAQAAAAQAAAALALAAASLALAAAALAFAAAALALTAAAAVAAN